MSRINELISYYPEDKRKSALLPVLHEVQDAENWLSIELMDKVAEILYIKPIEVYEVVVYTMYNQRPIGKYMFEFCQTSLVV
jgi:NADH-quinone oxidoreductase subunit E